MGGTDRFDDGEPEPGSATGAGAGLVGAIEAFEHVGQSMSRNTEAVVGDFEDRTIPLAANAAKDAIPAIESLAKSAAPIVPAPGAAICPAPDCRRPPSSW